MSEIRDALTPRRTPSQQRSRARVEHILNVTRELLREFGGNAVTTTRIAERAGLPVGSVYQYFPNKKAIFVALYDGVLGRVRAVVEAFERDGPYGDGWEGFFSQLAVATKRAEAEGRLELELRMACQSFPELREIDRRHAEFVADALSRMMRRLGSRWPVARLRRLAMYAYYLNEGSLLYRRDHPAPARETDDWDRRMLLDVFRHCFEG